MPSDDFSSLRGAGDFKVTGLVDTIEDKMPECLTDTLAILILLSSPTHFYSDPTLL